MKKIVMGILAHVDAGKTTLTEALLYKSGAIDRPGRVDNKDAFLDNYDIERARGITVFSKQAVIHYGDVEYTLIDTPGHVDFGAEMERSLMILDYAVLEIDGSRGVQSIPRHYGASLRITGYRHLFLSIKWTGTIPTAKQCLTEWRRNFRTG